jgi:hypothetical protein
MWNINCKANREKHLECSDAGFASKGIACENCIHFKPALLKTKSLICEHQITPCAIGSSLRREWERENSAFVGNGDNYLRFFDECDAHDSIRRAVDLANA